MNSRYVRLHAVPVLNKLTAENPDYEVSAGCDSSSSTGRKLLEYEQMQSEAMRSV